MKPLLVHPNPVPQMIARALQDAGLTATPVGAIGASGDSGLPEAPAGGWGGAVIATDHSSAAAWRLAEALRDADPVVAPIIMVISSRELDDLDGRDSLFDDFCVMPCEPREFDRRLQHAMWRTGSNAAANELIVYDELMLNVETYEAAIAGRELELTHMEYELLKYLASSPGRVFTREVLLSQVWGYDYFGGARTVDVHIRRLRSKLGEQHASMIQTVRSVGYSLGQSRWNA